MPHTVEPIEIVIIDDDQDHLSLLERALREPASGNGPSPDLHPHCYSDPAEALTGLPPDGPVVVLIDYSMPGATGLDWLPDFLRLDRGPVIILTGHGDEDIAARAFRCGAADYLVKSNVLEHPELLRRAIGEAWRRHRLEHRNRQLTRELKLANDVLETKNVKLRRMTSQAHQFVDDVAHDLRTPLAVIGEFASIIQDGLDGPVTPDQSEHLGIIRSTVRELSQMVDDFLDSSRLKSGCLKVDRTAHDVADLLEHLRPVLHAAAQGRSIKLVTTAEPGLPPVFADRSKVERIVTNLVQNAVKFSTQGSTVTLSAEGAGDGTVRFAVTDEGPGMTPEQVEHVFERFSQLEGEARTKGFGLGLDIVRALVRLNLGVLEVDSEPGRGSTFAFTLPVHQPDAIIGAFLAQDLQAPVTAMEATISGDDGVTPEQLRSFLASASYPTDVVMVHPDEPACLLVGRTAEPGEWSDRLRRLEGAPAFEVRALGTWRGGSEAREELLRVVGLGRACAV